MVDKDTEAAIIIQKLEHELADEQAASKARTAMVRRQMSELENALHGLEKQMRALREAVG